MAGSRKKADVKGLALMFIVLLVFWLLLSLSYDWQHMIIGVLLSILLVAFWNKIALREDAPHTGFTLKQVWLVTYYLLYLVVDVIKANISVAIIVLSPKLPISPGLVIMKNELKKDLPRVFFANSITLTPGTITVDLEGDLLIVHAFTRGTAVGVQEWFLYDLMRKIEGDDSND